MPNCSKCGTAAAFHELSNFGVPAQPGETVERVCFKCTREELDRVKAQCAAMRRALQEVLAHNSPDINGVVVWIGEGTILLCQKALEQFDTAQERAAWERDAKEAP